MDEDAKRVFLKAGDLLRRMDRDFGGVRRLVRMLSRNGEADEEEPQENGLEDHIADSTEQPLFNGQYDEEEPDEVVQSVVQDLISAVEQNEENEILGLEL